MNDGTATKVFEEYLADVAAEDVQGLVNARKHYGESWKKRGGVGAYMNVARKIDRLDRMLSADVRVGMTTLPQYDIFAHCEHNNYGEGVIDTVRDLRRYLLLIEVELRMQGVQLPVSRDNK